MQKLKYLIIFIITCLSFSEIVKSEVKSYEGYKVFSLFPEIDQDLELINTIIQNTNLDVWRSVRMIGKSTDIMVPPIMQNEFMSNLNLNNISYNITIDNVERLVQQESRQSKNIMTKFETKYNNEKYYKHSEINSYLNYLQLKYPHLVKVINIGKSYEGRELNLIHISSGSGNIKKPAILIEGGIHAREWISPASVLYIINQLVEISQNNWLIDNVDWYLIPVLNPDGYDHTFKTERLWRKTRSKVFAGCIGVDANRNFNYKWRHSRNCDSTYSGNYSFSEPELRAYAKFAESIKKKLKLYISFHSYGEIILYPWGYTKEEYPNNYKELKETAEKVAKLIGPNYKTGTPPELLYNAFGNSMDWFKGVLGVDFAYTIELSPAHSGYAHDIFVGFVLSPKKIKEVGSKVFRGIIHLEEFIKRKYL